MQYRQGDVWIERTTQPATGHVVSPVNGRLVLAYGEVTGHHHSLPMAAGTLRRTSEGVTFLTIDQLTEVTHQEHAPIPLTPGVYIVKRQREYAGPARQQYVGD